MHEYDVALKRVLRGKAREVLRQLTGLTIVEWLNIELPEVRNLHVDLLCRDPRTGRLFHIELQSTNNPHMPLRMAEYALAIYRRFGSFPRQIVLYVGDSPLTMKNTLKGPRHEFSFEIVDARDLKAEQLLDSPDVGDNVIAILARLADERKAVQRLLEKIAAQAQTERAEALSELVILAGLRGAGRVIAEEVKNMPILNDILDHDLLGPEIRRGIQLGREEGLQEGLRKGRQEGRQEAGITLLRRLLERRFGPLPEWVISNLENRSLAALEALFDRALDAPSLEELLRYR